MLMHVITCLYMHVMACNAEVITYYCLMVNLYDFGEDEFS